MCEVHQVPGGVTVPESEGALPKPKEVTLCCDIGHSIYVEHKLDRW